MDELLARVTGATGLEASIGDQGDRDHPRLPQEGGPARRGPAAPRRDAWRGDGACPRPSDSGAAQGLAGAVSGMGGGVMALGTQLMGAGVSMGEMQPLGRELFAYGREKAGEDVMGSIVGSIPGLSQFV